LAQVETVLTAVWRAREQGLALNRFITIDLERAGVAQPVEAIGRFLKLIQDALRRRGKATAYVWVQEGGTVVGQHVHLVLHVPAELRHWFARRQAGWLKRCGAERLNGCVDTRAVGHSYGAAFGDDAARTSYDTNLAVLLDYVLKDADAKARAALGIQRLGQFGAVSGKRIGVSQNIRTRPGVLKSQSARRGWMASDHAASSQTKLAPRSRRYRSGGAGETGSSGSSNSV
jgi:hypothetical protein